MIVAQNMDCVAQFVAAESWKKARSFGRVALWHIFPVYIHDFIFKNSERENIFFYIENVRFCATVPQNENITETAWFICWQSCATRCLQCHSDRYGRIALSVGLFCGNVGQFEGHVTYQKAHSFGRVGLWDIFPPYTPVYICKDTKTGNDFSYIENVRICPTVPQQGYIVEIAWLFLWDSRPTEFHTSHKNTDRHCN